MSQKNYIPIYETTIKRKEPTTIEYKFTPTLTPYNPSMFKDIEKPNKKSIVM